MKKVYNKKNIKNPIATFTPPPIVNFDGVQTDVYAGTTGTTNSSSNASNGLTWVDSIGKALGGLLDKFSPIATAIWGGNKSANVVDDSRNTTNFILIGGVVIVVIILILFLNKK
ncbi:MAG: hypothetical protein UD103_07750 [Bacteroidales bacterium]|nr:hypothetical protein [Bacteroidales bacterium]